MADFGTPAHRLEQAISAAADGATAKCYAGDIRDCGGTAEGTPGTVHELPIADVQALIAPPAPEPEPEPAPMPEPNKVTVVESVKDKVKPKGGK